MWEFAKRRGERRARRETTEAEPWPGEPPRCSLSPPRPGELGATRSALRPIGRDAFARLHAEAGLRYGEGEQRGGSSGGLATLNLYDRNGESVGPSFLCQWHVVDARLQV